MDSHHLRFNQSYGSFSLIVQTGFLAKNQLPSVNPDPIVIPYFARTCKRENLDRLLCPIRALKFYLKRLVLTVRTEPDYSYPFKAIKIYLNIRFLDGYLTLSNLPIGNSLNETFLSLRSKPMKSGPFRLLGHSLIRFLLVIFFKQRYGVNLLRLLDST